MRKFFLVSDCDAYRHGRMKQCRLKAAEAARAVSTTVVEKADRLLDQQVHLLIISARYTFSTVVFKQQISQAASFSELYLLLHLLHLLREMWAGFQSFVSLG